MTTDYKKLLELCPEIDKADEELRKALPSHPQDFREMLAAVDRAGAKATQGALEAQPELLEASHSAQERIERERGTPESVQARIDVRASALDQLRKVCRTPSS